MKGVGILGAGRVSGGHAHAIEQDERLKLVAVAEPDEQRRARFIERHGCEGYANHQDLLQRDDIDLVLMGLPHWLHAPLAIDALNAGKHVMVEKPMAITVEECDAMIEAAERNAVRLMVGHTQQFFPVNRAVKAAIDAGEIGEVIMATETWYKPFGLAARPPWFRDRAKGGGMWLMNGAHMLDRLLWMIDSPVVAVKGMVTNKAVHQNADDSSMALVHFENGVYATIVHHGYPHPDRPVGEDLLIGDVIGTEGVFRTHPYRGQGWIMREAGKFVPIDVPRGGGMLDEVAAFVDAIESGSPPPISNAHARAVVEVMIAVEESSRTGREVRLD